MATTREIPPQIKTYFLQKVATYCYVSANAQDQVDTLTVQNPYYKERIKANQRWRFVEIYLDVGSRTLSKGGNG